MQREWEMSEESDMLCPKCHKEGKNKIMEIRGTQWYCPEHFLYIDFPTKPATYEELKHQKEILERENAHLKEILDHYDIKD